MKNLQNQIKQAVIIVILLSVGSVFAADQTKKSIVCVQFPGYDWVMQILGGRAADWDVTLLQAKGTDVHSWQPTFSDIAKISRCDLFVYNGGESDGWADKALQNAANRDMTAANLMEMLGERVREEEHVEGMQDDEEEDDDDDALEYDEHIWLSLQNAIVLVGALAEVIAQADGEHEAVYRDNAAAYIAQLSALDQEYAAVTAAAPRNVILFGDRFPFRYMADDYGLRYYAAFAGCSTESEASFETIVFLANKADELGLTAILTIEKSNKKIAKTIAANTKAKKMQIMEMDSLQSVTAKEIKKGKSYLSAMRHNLDTLRAALQ